MSESSLADQHIDYETAEIEGLVYYSEDGVFKGNVLVEVLRPDIPLGEMDLPWRDQITVTVRVVGGRDMTFEAIEEAMVAQAIASLNVALENLKR